jgi:hypothetical protein
VNDLPPRKCTVQFSGFRPKKLGLLLSLQVGGLLSCGSGTCVMKRGGVYRPMTGGTGQDLKGSWDLGSTRHPRPDLLSVDPGHTTSHLLLSPQLGCSTTGGEAGGSGKATQGPLGVPCKPFPRLGFSVCEWSLSTPAQVRSFAGCCHSF